MFEQDLFSKSLLSVRCSSLDLVSLKSNDVSTVFQDQFLYFFEFVRQWEQQEGKVFFQVPQRRSTTRTSKNDAHIRRMPSVTSAWDESSVERQGSREPQAKEPAAQEGVSRRVGTCLHSERDNLVHGCGGSSASS